MTASVAGYFRPQVSRSFGPISSSYRNVSSKSAVKEPAIPAQEASLFDSSISTRGQCIGLGLLAAIRGACSPIIAYLCFYVIRFYNRCELVDERWIDYTCTTAACPSFRTVSECFEHQPIAVGLFFGAKWIALVTLGALILTFFSELLCVRLGLLVERMRVSVFKAFLVQEAAFFDDPTHSAANAAEMLEGLELLRVVPILQIQVPARLFVLFSLWLTESLVLDWQLTLIVLATLPIIFVGPHFAAAKETSPNDEALKILLEIISSLHTCKALRSRGKWCDLYHATLVRAQPHYIAIAATQFFNSLPFRFLNFVIFFAGANLISLDQLGFQDTLDKLAGVLVFLIFFIFDFGLTAALITVPAWEVNAIKNEALMFINKANLKENQKEKKQKNKPSCAGKIEFTGVKFCFPSRPSTVILEDFSLVIEAGTTVALCGGSGSGKSTCVQLIERFYEPAEGTITLDGRDINTLDVKWLRGQLGLVGQEPALFSMSILENIRLGKPGATLEEVQEAARAARAHDFIVELPEGYDTQYGPGAALSGGQKQRIAIARAMVLDPPIMLLDEATSALDPVNEKLVQEALDALMMGRTTIVVAHRLSTITNADKIVVMDHGRIIEQGTYTGLMSSDVGVFKGMVGEQAASAKDYPKSDDEDEDESQQSQGGRVARSACRMLKRLSTMENFSTERTHKTKLRER